MTDQLKKWIILSGEQLLRLQGKDLHTTKRLAGTAREALQHARAEPGEGIGHAYAEFREAQSRYLDQAARQRDTPLALGQPGDVAGQAAAVLGPARTTDQEEARRAAIAKAAAEAKKEEQDKERKETAAKDLESLLKSKDRELAAWRRLAESAGYATPEAPPRYSSVVEEPDQDAVKHSSPSWIKQRRQRDRADPYTSPLQAPPQWLRLGRLRRV